MLATVLPVAVFMLILYRLWSVYQVTKNTLESIPALGQDFFTVSNKEKSAGFSRVFFTEIPVIKCSNYGFSSTGRGNNQISETMPNLSLRRQFVQYRLLIWIGPYIKKEFFLCQKKDIKQEIV